LRNNVELCSLSVDFKAKLSVLSSQEGKLYFIAMQQPLCDLRDIPSQIADWTNANQLFIVSDSSF
jgi:hypothetical protein